MPRPIELVICGAGSRGLDVYASYCERHRGQVRIAAVADPLEARRELAREQFRLRPEQLFRDWREVAGQGRLGDAVVVATQDQEHTEPALAFLEGGYHVLLEKPMATSEEECKKIVEVAEASQRIVAVCHVLRYTPYFRELKNIIDEGALGEVVTVRHFEPVNFWHFAHSFVRGNWRNEELSSPFILAKSCHDLDILMYLLGRSCRRLSSFGSLHHFRPEQAPPQATERCLDCSLVEEGCAYSAPRFYGQMLEAGHHWWPLNVVTQDFSEPGLRRALKTGPYGRCVYACDNDVVDHQVVTMEFEGGVTATFTATAFTDHRERETEILGTRGAIRGNGTELIFDDFESRSGRRWVIESSGNHLGGDDEMMREFVLAVQHNDPSHITTSPRESLASHCLAFAAERARRSGRIVEL